MSCDTLRLEAWSRIGLETDAAERLFNEGRARWWNLSRSERGTVRSTDRAAQIMGYSFNKEKLDSAGEAREIGESDDGWKKHEWVLRKAFLPAHNIANQDVAVDYTIGLWEGPEPSFVAAIKAPRDSVLELGKAWGAIYDQQAVAVLLPNRFGSGGILEWNFGRELGDSEMDNVLSALQEVNAYATTTLGHSAELGLTIRERSRVEFWFGDDEESKAAELLIARVLRDAGLEAQQQPPRGGYDFELLFRGEDY